MKSLFLREVAIKLRIMMLQLETLTIDGWPFKILGIAYGQGKRLQLEVLYSEHIQTIARELPSEQLLTETDNPGGPKSFIGALGMPVLIRDVVQGVAELRETTVEAVIHTVQANFVRLIWNDLWLSDVYTRIFESSIRAAGAVQ